MSVTVLKSNLHNNGAAGYNGYNDAVVQEEDDFVRVEFDGQNRGQKDHLVASGAYFFQQLQANTPLHLLGQVVEATQIRPRRQLQPARYRLKIRRLALGAQPGGVAEAFTGPGRWLMHASLAWFGVGVKNRQAGITLTDGPPIRLPDLR